MNKPFLELDRLVAVKFYARQPKLSQKYIRVSKGLDLKEFQGTSPKNIYAK